MQMVQRYSKTTYMALCGLFAALMAICSFISIPLGFTPVPVNLATLGVFLAGGLLGKKYGTISLAVYVLIGAVGIPVFAEFRGGLSVLAGPTGGYIIGYIVAAFLTGLIIDTAWKRPERGTHDNADRTMTSTNDNTVQSRTRQLIICAVAMITGLAACYLLGTVWFMFSTHTGLWASLVACVFPFLPGDALKIIAGSLLVQKLRNLL